jgi:lipoyl(octanoyl) transferase
MEALSSATTSFSTDGGAGEGGQRRRLNVMSAGEHPSCRRGHDPVRVDRLGSVDYLAAWDIQRAHAAARREGTGPDVLMLLEHPSVYTAGKRTRPADRPTDGTPVVDVDRGGQITWHGPGQLVGYPIVALGEPLDVVDYVRRLEEALITVVAGLGLTGAGRVAGRSGVWLPADDARPERKIAAIGVRVQGGVTQHGFALNCEPDLAAFDRIVPCGITDAGVTSLAVELGRPVPVAEVVDAVADAVTAVLDGTIPVADHPVARLAAPAGLDLRLHPALR